MSSSAVLDTSTWAFGLTSSRQAPARGAIFGLASDHQTAPSWRKASAPIPAAHSVPGVALGPRAPSVVMAELQREHNFMAAFASGLRFAAEMAAADEADAPNADIWAYAWRELRPFAPLLPPLLVNPLQLGGVSCEWHEVGINIELRFRGLADVFAVIEDARGELPEFYDRDLELRRAREALVVLAMRQA